MTTKQYDLEKHKWIKITNNDDSLSKLNKHEKPVVSFVENEYIFYMDVIHFVHLWI